MSENNKSPKTKKGANAPFYYGGQAVIEGVMMVGKSGAALAVRAEDGDIQVERKRKPQKKTPGIYKWPVIRGVIGFISSMVTGIKMLSRSAEAFGGEDDKVGKGGIAIAMILGLGLFVVLFMVLPMVIAGGLKNLFNLPDDDVIWQNIIESGIRIIFFIAYLLLVTLMKDIRRTFMYHGAEHKTINCFEKGGEMAPGAIRAYSKRHNRCGTTFLFFVIIISIIVFSLVTWALYGLGVTENAVGGRLAFALIKTGVRLLLLPFVAGLSYELLRLLAKGGDNVIMKILRAPGLALQGLTTKEPTFEMIEVALAAFNAAREMDTDPKAPDREFDLPVNFQPFYKAWQAKAAENNVESASVDFLICGVLNSGQRTCGRGDAGIDLRRSELPAIKTVKGSQKVRLENALSDLVYKSEPYQYILGTADFYGIRLKVNKDVLIPRLDTEVLADAAVKQITNYITSQFSILNSQFKILDLCCGSGCIGIAVAKHTDIPCDFADNNAAALKVAEENAKAAGIKYETVQSDLFANLSDRKYDIIVCNPPYIKTGELASLPADVKKEPVSALDGGADGLDFYRRIAHGLATHMNTGARAYFEIGDGQAADVCGIFGAAGFSVQTVNDLSGKERIIILIPL